MVKYILTYLIVCMAQIVTAQNLSVSKINIVGDADVYAPVYYHNKIVVCSNKKDEIFHTILDASNKYPINLFVLEQLNKDTLTLKPFIKTFKTQFNDGPITFNNDYSQCFISQNYPHLKKENNNLKLTPYVLKNNKWIKDSSFTYNNPNFSLTHPVLSFKGDVLIFSSNMPGGYGGFDLWKSIKVNGIWSQPINMGSNINSSANEFFPTFVDELLYFSSDRNNGYGGLDIYKSNLLENTPPTLLPKPINSSFDDFSLISTTSILEDGYFSTNRDGKDELWHFTYNFPVFNKCDSIIDDNFCYTLYEESAVTIPNQEALIYKWTINGEKRQGAEVKYCFPGPGNYEIILDVEDTIAHINYDKQSHLNITLDNAIQPYITSLDTVEVNTLFYLSALESNLPYITNKSYYWLIENKKMIGDQTSYKFKLPGIYNVQLGVIGYEDTIKVTDCVYKAIVCVEKKDNINLINDFALLKSEFGSSFLVLNNSTKQHQIDEMFSLKTINQSESDTLNKNEQNDLIKLARFLEKHPNVMLSLTYEIDAKNSNQKEKVNAIHKYLLLQGIEQERINLVTQLKSEKNTANNIIFNFNLYENN